MQLFSYFTPLKHKNSFSDDFLTFSGGGGEGGDGKRPVVRHWLIGENPELDIILMPPLVEWSSSFSITYGVLGAQ